MCIVETRKVRTQRISDWRSNMLTMHSTGKSLSSGVTHLPGGIYGLPKRFRLRVLGLEDGLVLLDHLVLPVALAEPAAGTAEHSK